MAPIEIIKLLIFPLSVMLGISFWRLHLYNKKWEKCRTVKNWEAFEKAGFITTILLCIDIALGIVIWLDASQL